MDDNRSQIIPDGTYETEFAEIDFIALSQDSSISNCRSVIDQFNDKEFDGIEGFCAIEKNESKLVLKRYKNPGYHSQADIAKDKQFLRNKVCSLLVILILILKSYTRLPLVLRSDMFFLKIIVNL